MNHHPTRQLSSKLFRLAPVLLLALAVTLSVWGARPAAAAPCKPDGAICSTNQSCCGANGRNGVCVTSTPPGKRAKGLCCTRTATSDTTCDGRDDDCDGVADEGYVAVPTTCGSGDCASTGSLVCENGSLRDTCSASATDGDVCNDGSVCTADDACAGGQCTGSRLDGCCETDQECTFPSTCGGGGTPNACGCIPSTCTGSDCGPTSDGCGGTLTCPCIRCRGTCNGGLTTIGTVCGRGCNDESECASICETECLEHAGVGCESSACQPCEP
jgi:hypothetical protein